ncbi:MAG: ABC transporter ATP-binding protein [Bacteroidota bacterium]
MIEFIGFKKFYGNQLALEIPDCTIQEGIYWVKGVNGSGKSSLLKSMAGMLAHQGDILVDGVSIKKEPENYRSKVNFGEAEPVYPEFITGNEMIGFFISAKKGDSLQTTKLIERMQMAHFLDAPVKSYSSGMLKKLSLVLAFIGNPKVILLDEPLTTIDTAALNILYGLINEYRHQHGITFLITSHQALDAQILKDVQQLTIENKTLRRF